MTRAKLDGKLQFKSKEKYIDKIEALLHREMDALPKNNELLNAQRMPMTLNKVQRNLTKADISC